MKRQIPTKQPIVTSELESINMVGDFYASVDEFVIASGGNHAINKILVANNGVGATKAIRSIRKWAFETFRDEKKVHEVMLIDSK
jgi:hypothetical protein